MDSPSPEVAVSVNDPIPGLLYVNVAAEVPLTVTLDGVNVPPADPSDSEITS